MGSMVVVMVWISDGVGVGSVMVIVTSMSLHILYQNSSMQYAPNIHDVHTHTHTHTHTPLQSLFLI